MERDNQKPMNIKIHKGFWTRDQVARDVNSVYVFGDNSSDAITKYVPSSTQACIRGLNNAVGLPTKLTRFTDSKSYMNDNLLSIFRIMVDTTILHLKNCERLGKTVVFPGQGLGTGKAMLKEKAPMCWEYLCKRLKEEFNYENGQTN